jgi:hypothetical protein
MNVGLSSPAQIATECAGVFRIADGMFASYWY